MSTAVSSSHSTRSSRSARSSHARPTDRRTLRARALPTRFDRRVKDLRQLRHRTELATVKMHEETRALAIKLVSQGLTLRSVGELLGITYQRVQQILKGE